METVSGENQRTLKQNKSLHKYFAMLADALNSAGLDMRVVLKPGVEIPWTEDSVKNHLWRPIQRIVTDDIESTADLSTTDVDAIFQVVSRHIAEKHGVSVPFPDRFSQSEESQ